MQNKKPIDVLTIFKDKLGDKLDDFSVPPPIFEVMKCEIIELNENEKSIVIRVPLLKEWLNPFGTLQGGMIGTAIDNAVGPLSLLVAPVNVTRTIETKILKSIEMKLEYIYVKAKLIEEKKRRLIFESTVEDDKGMVYAKATVVNFIL